MVDIWEYFVDTLTMLSAADETPATVASTAFEKRASIAVIIPTFNHAHFLADAIRSVLAQTRPADEIVVIDDGSTDDPAAVVAKFQSVKLIYQTNRGLAGARNTGLRNCTSDYVIFLDADDLLLPQAIEAGLSCMADRPECAFVYGGHRLTSMDGRPLSPDSYHQIFGDAHLALLSENNKIVSIASVLFRRKCLLAENGFDETLRRCEDYDLFLRLAYRHPIAGHPTIVTEYRRHEQNMSGNYAAQLETVLQVLDRHEKRIAIDRATRVAFRKGRAHVHYVYVAQMLSAAFGRWRKENDTKVLLRELVEAASYSPISVIRKALSVLARPVFRALPRPIGQWVRRLRDKI